MQHNDLQAKIKEALLADDQINGVEIDVDGDLVVIDFDEDSFRVVIGRL